MRVHKIAVIPGDGVGKEVAEEGVKALKAVSQAIGDLQFEFTEFPWGCDYYLENNEMMPADGLDQLKKFDAIYLGAIGDPRVPDHISLRDLLLKIRFGFDQYVNLRPVKLLEGVNTPIKGKTAEDIDFVVIRENTEGFYIGSGGIYKKGSPEHAKYAELSPVFADSEEIAEQIGLFSTNGIKRIARYSFQLAQKRKGKLACCTKSNALNYSMVLWDRIFKEMSEEYPGVEVSFFLVDALCMHMVQNPQWFDVIAAPNLFGDIITDLGAALQGGLGVACSGNINPESISMFEPVHGSAPDIAGKNIAGPIAAIWTARMMLDELGEKKAADMVMRAIEKVLKEGKVRTKDLGGTSKTFEVGDAIVEKIKVFVK
ncbi:MAG: 3-isopropylmalate dehydrogenase [Candidatus Omnitrophica bacterium]|nr:3-isopropylmalate dehydrogenase [Candidatus Omnitrophota bacterium]